MLITRSQDAVYPWLSEEGFLHTPTSNNAGEPILLVVSGDQPQSSLHSHRALKNNKKEQNFRAKGTFHWGPFSHSEDWGGYIAYPIYLENIYYNINQEKIGIPCKPSSRTFLEKFGHLLLKCNIFQIDQWYHLNIDILIERNAFFGRTWSFYVISMS